LHPRRETNGRDGWSTAALVACCRNRSSPTATLAFDELNSKSASEVTDNSPYNASNSQSGSDVGRSVGRYRNAENEQIENEAH
jgi:hypothetical protein